MKKINCLMILILLLGVNFVKANKPNVGGLNVSHLNAGMYIIHVTDGEKSVSLKLAKN